MKIMLVNGSPRKEWNTATLLKHALQGAQSQGAEAELIHLYDLNYKGCKSCFGCKEKGGKSYGQCASKDDLTPVLKRVEECGALILGSPVYLASMTGETQSFMERLVFQYLTYTDPPQSLFPKKIRTGFIYTMGVTEEQMREYGYGRHFETAERYLARIFGSSEMLCCFDTYQFADYHKVVATRFDPEQKLKRRKEVFPEDCRKAYDMGVRFAGHS
ncbi:MAG: flavodoxin family protein [Candidatus Omnitrophota bacterium]|jgi:multimeric flavodoxin WrbA